MDLFQIDFLWPKLFVIRTSNFSLKAILPHQKNNHLKNLNLKIDQFCFSKAEVATQI